MAGTYVPGWSAKLLINGARFAFQHANVHTQIDNLRTTNSEGYGAPTPTPGVHVSINGNGLITLRVVMASWDSTANPFLAPFLIAAGSYVTFQLLPEGIGGVSYSSPSFHILECDHDIDVLALQPFTFSGEGNGNWSNASA